MQQKSRKQPKQGKKKAKSSQMNQSSQSNLVGPISSSMPMRSAFTFEKPYGNEVASVVERLTVSSSSTGLSYVDLPTYTQTNSIAPISTLFTIFTYYEVTSIEFSYTPITYVSTSTTILEFFFSVNPITSYGTPAAPTDPLNYPGVKCCMANSSSFRTVIKPCQILKKLGYPYQFTCGVTPSVQPHIRYGIIGGTTTTALGIISCRYTYKLSGLTNNADGVAKIKNTPMMELKPVTDAQINLHSELHKEVQHSFEDLTESQAEHVVSVLKLKKM